METTFCTIITKSHLRFALTLHMSYRKFGNYQTKVLIVDGSEKDVSDYLYPGVHYLFPGQINLERSKEVKNKYGHIKSSDYYRWSMKPVLMYYLLNQEGYDRVIYVDSDLFFYQSPQFLIDLLEEHSILLTPHHHHSDPKIDETDFLRNFKHGHYNAGFVGASRRGLKALDWWAVACIYKMGRIPKLGIFDDQAYLNLMPVYFEKVFIVHHSGCNLHVHSPEHPRSIINGQLLISNSYPLVFAHFRREYIRLILSGKDPLMQEKLEEYRDFICREFPDFDFNKWVFDQEGGVLNLWRSLKSSFNHINKI